MLELKGRSKFLGTGCSNEQLLYILDFFLLFRVFAYCSLKLTLAHNFESFAVRKLPYLYEIRKCIFAIVKNCKNTNNNNKVDLVLSCAATFTAHNVTSATRLTDCLLLRCQHMSVSVPGPVAVGA